MFTGRVRISLPHELGGTPTMRRTLEIRETGGAAVVEIVIRDAQEVVRQDDADLEASLQGERPEDDLEASLGLDETTIARLVGLDPADAAQTERTAVRLQDPPSEDVQDPTHVRDGVLSPSLACDRPRNPERESERGHRVEDHEALSEVSSELAPSLPYQRTDSNDHPPIWMLRKRRHGSRSKSLRVRRRPRPIWLPKRKHEPRANLCLASTLISTNVVSVENVLLWTEVSIAVVSGLLRCDVALRRRLIAMCRQGAVGDEAGPLGIETGGSLSAVIEAVRLPDESTGTETAIVIVIAIAQGIV